MIKNVILLVISFYIGTCLGDAILRHTEVSIPKGQLTKEIQFVRIESVVANRPHSSCSGAIVATNLVLTAKHCTEIGATYRVFIEFLKKSEPFVFQQAGMGDDFAQDWALLSGNTGTIAPLVVQADLPPFFDKLVLVGYPQATPQLMRGTRFIDSGIVSQNFILLGEAAPGDSGGPLVNMQGEIVGIASRSAYPIPIFLAVAASKFVEAIRAHH
jgi:S1-C subfamily serine protease